MATNNRLYRRPEACQTQGGNKPRKSWRSRLFVLIGLALFISIPLGSFWPARVAQAAPAVIATIPAGGGVMVAVPSTNKVYVAQDPATTVAVISGTTNAVVGTLATSGYHSGLGVNPATNRVYISQAFAAQVRVIDAASDTELANFSVPGTLHTISAVGINPSTNRIYVVRNNNGDVAVMDGTTYALVATIALAPCGTNCGFGSPAIAVNPETNRIYIVGRDNSTKQLYVIDGDSQTLISSLTLPDPFGVAVNPVTNRVYVSNAAYNNVTVLDGATNLELDTDGNAGNGLTRIPVGNGPLGVGTNPNTNRVYVANSGNNAVSIIAGASNMVVATVPVGNQPAHLTVNPNTSRIYVSNDGADTVSVIEDQVYSFSGFFQPVDNPGPGPRFVFNVVRAGRAIPVKFSLNGYQGLNIFQPGYPASQLITCEAAGELDPIEETAPPGSSTLTYEPITDRYTYVWQTNTAWANTCRKLSVRLNDLTEHIAYFKFTR